MKYKFDYSEEKDAVLRAARGLGFREIVEEINNGNLLDDIDHFNKRKYPNQRILIIKAENKVYAVPYVVDKIKKIKFLKTLYPNRKLKKKYLDI